MTLVNYSVNDHGVARVCMNSPGTRNALGTPMMLELLESFERAECDSEVRVVVLCSSDTRVFSAGGDIKSFGADRSPLEKYQDLEVFPRLYTLIAEMGKPVVCAVNGDALAGALGLALACDLVIAKAGTRLGCPEVSIGLFPFMISALIYRSVSRLKANELLMMGETLDVEEARELGLVNVVVPGDRFDAVVDEWAARLSSKSAMTLRLGKKAVQASRDMTLSQAFSMLQGQLALSFTSDDFREGLNAFVEKRTPRWTGR